MRSLTAHQILQLWDICRSQHPIDRGLTLLSFAIPGKSTDELASLSIGLRDACLLKLREVTLGSKMESYAECPKCGERLEFTLNVDDIRVAPAMTAAKNEYTLVSEPYQLKFRLPNSKDLAAIVGYKDLNAARNLIGQRCVLAVMRDGTNISYSDLPEVVVTQLAERMAEYDPQAEILLNMNCPACGHDWQVLFDIVTFFWSELNVKAKRLLQEVHILARFYSWSEVDILSMSETRRLFYLNLIDGDG
ncbi:MAG: phage baseplate protein [Calothrix sp. SM1_7_51]|nr:phage baseplate protein [Calothrix sp. SM1_7_51]